MKLQRIIVLILLLFSSGSSYAQIRLLGGIFSKEDSSPVEFSYMTIMNSDSTKVEASLTDMKGMFEFADLKPGKYIYRIESFGYKPKSGDIEISLPPDGSTISMDFFLEIDTISLDEAVVSSSSVQKNSRKTDYIITEKDILDRNNGLEVIQTLPDLYFDVKEQKLKPLSGSNLKILINGASSSEHDLRAISPKQVKKIEYYDFPPEKYADYSRVINVITRYNSTGFYVGAGAQQAFTTGFCNDDIYLKYNWGVNQLSLSWDLEHRKYKDSEDAELYKYNLGGKDVQRESRGTLSFGYDSHDLNLSYIRNVDNKYLLQASFMPHILNYKSSSLSIIEYNEDALSFRNQINNVSRYDFHPSLDIYSQIFFENGNDLTINAVETIFRAGNDNYNIEQQEDVTIFEDDARQSNMKNSTIANVEYCFNHSWGSIIAGTKYQYSFLNENILNSFGDGNYKTKTKDWKLYTQADGQIGKKLTYSVNCGASYYYQQNAIQSYSTWIFSPAISLNYNLNGNLSLRFRYERENEIPSLSQLSSSKIYITEDIVKEGNPWLLNSLSNNMALSMFFHNKWLDLSASAQFRYKERPINAYYSPSFDHIALRYENGIYRTLFSGEIQARISPFKNRLFELRLLSGVSQTRVNSDFVGYYSYTNIPFAFIVDFNYKAFTLSYMGNIIGYNIDGPLLTSDEKMSNLSAQYAWKNWTVSASVIGLFSGVYYKSKSFNDDVLHYESNLNILDNHNMFTLGLRYYFQCGKEYKRGTKYLNNSDNDSGLFE